MTIYVDDAIWLYRGQLWCHMMTDGEMSELHFFAARIGLRRSWFQSDSPSHLPHYDLSPEYRKKAIMAGATYVDNREIVKRCTLKGRPIDENEPKILLGPRQLELFEIQKTPVRMRPSSSKSGEMQENSPTGQEED